MRSPPPMPPRTQTGLSTAMRAVVDPAQVPAIVARLWGERENQEDWKSRHAQRLAIAENEIEETKDALARIDLKLAEIQHELKSMEARMKDAITLALAGTKLDLAVEKTKIQTAVAVIAGIGAAISGAIGLWLGFRK